MEKWQKLTAGLNPNQSHAHLFKPWKKDVQSNIKVGMKLYKELRLQGTHCLYWGQKMTKVEKMTKINSRIISKPHAHLQTMEKTCKVSKRWCKIELRSQGTHCLYTCLESEIRKRQKVHKVEKEKKQTNNYIQTTCTSSYHEKKRLQSFKKIDTKL